MGVAAVDLRGGEPSGTGARLLVRGQVLCRPLLEEYDETPANFIDDNAVAGCLRRGEDAGHTGGRGPGGRNSNGRTLAEEAGQLDKLNEMTLPDRTLSGGVREVLRRRLNRVPESARPLLKLASVAGRQLDLPLLEALEPETDFETWLRILSNVAVIEVQGENWRFAHDKLREEIKESLGHEEHHQLHRRVAEGLEAVYPGDSEHTAALAYHWHVAGDREKERYYTELAAKQAAGR